MNRGEGYITTEISQRKEKKKERKKGKKPKEKGERLLGWERSWEFKSPGEGSFLPRT